MLDASLVCLWRSRGPQQHRQLWGQNRVPYRLAVSSGVVPLDITNPNRLESVFYKTLCIKEKDWCLWAIYLPWRVSVETNFNISLQLTTGIVHASEKWVVWSIRLLLNFCVCVCVSMSHSYCLATALGEGKSMSQTLQEWRRQTDGT